MVDPPSSRWTVQEREEDTLDRETRMHQEGGCVSMLACRSSVPCRSTQARHLLLLLYR